MNDLLDTGSNSNQPLNGSLPNAVAVLVLGIISIVGCLFYGVPGLICGIIAMVMHRKDKTIWLSNPEKYDEAFKTSKAGYICAIIGLSLSALYIIVLAIAIPFAIAGSRF
jgi:hypothetical protein